ncbi:MAG: type II toxin-antitoxin system HigB family toxin [Prevotellaceae bacterium]|nr:type II toxin-antitoxin system HigB family toxin [Prevotellaceae bacterium]
MLHTDCEQTLKSWFLEASKAAWKNPNKIKQEYPSASILIKFRNHENKTNKNEERLRTGAGTAGNDF